MDIEVEVKSYLRHCERDRKLDERTIKAYALDLKQFQKYLVNEDDINIAVLMYIKKLKDEHKPASAKRKIVVLKKFIDYLKDNDVIPTNPFWDKTIKNAYYIPQNFKEVKAASVGDIKRLVTFLHGKLGQYEYGTAGYNMTLRNIAMIELILSTGIRETELCNLAASDINFAFQELYIRKGSIRTLYINHSAIHSLKAYNYVLNPSRDYFFLNWRQGKCTDAAIRNMIYKYSDMAGIPRMEAKTLRHAFIKDLVNQGIEKSAIQNIAGQSDIPYINNNKKNNYQKILKECSLVEKI